MEFNLLRVASIADDFHIKNALAAIPFPHPLVSRANRITDIVMEQDVMLHFPYHSFNAVIDMLREAAIDPEVTTIKVTCYRLASNSKVINALINAVRNGKQVTAMMEYRARFDEEANLEWKVILEEEGVKDLGNVTLVMEDTRAAWSWIWLEQFFQDLRYAARTMLNNKAFTMLAALSLALGIGANTAIYSFMDTLLLRSLRVRDPQSLAVLNWQSRRGLPGRSVMHSMSGHTWAADGKNESGIFPFPAFELLRQNDSVFSTLFAYHPADKLNLTHKGQSDLVKGEYVSGDYFAGLDLPSAAGRLIAKEDNRVGAAAVRANG